MQNLKPRRYSNLSTARIKPAFPSWIRSRKLRPRLRYFLAIDTTSRRLPSDKPRLACLILGVDGLQIADAVAQAGGRFLDWPAGCCGTR